MTGTIVGIIAVGNTGAAAAATVVGVVVAVEESFARLISPPSIGWPGPPV